MYLKQNTSWCPSTNSQRSNTGILNTKNAYQICNDIVVSFNMFTNCDNLQKRTNTLIMENVHMVYRERLEWYKMQYDVKAT